jgi:ABC-2 type transport system permease protein
MSSAANIETIPANEADRPAPAPVQPFIWSVRREIWEHRAIWMAPLIAAGLVLFSFLFRILDLPRAIEQVNKLPPHLQAAAISAPFAIAAAAILVTGSVVSLFYCLGALNNERRDRSILFWKSLPVSDTTTVLSKAFIPFVVLPVVLFVVVIATQLAMMLLASGFLLVAGKSPALLWTEWPVLRLTVMLIYLMVITVLWHAPIYGWLLMVSSWARRMTFLWAVLPWPGLAILEKIAFDTDHIGSFLGYRLNGMVQEGFAPPPGFENHHAHFHMKDFPAIDPLSLMAPGHFLASPGLWLGLIAAAAFLAAAIYFRRMRDPG